MALGTPLADRDKFTDDDLAIEPFRHSGQVDAFYSGNPDLDNFLNTHEVSEYQRKRLGNTSLVFVEGELVAYYTLAMDSLKIEYTHMVKTMHHPNEQKIEAFPALLIGRLAVREDLRGKGIGRLLVERILAQATLETIPARLVVLTAEPDSVEFYKRLGFGFCTKRKNNPGRRKPVMYFDLSDLDE